MLPLFAAIISPVYVGTSIVGGIIVLALVWEKIRPVIIIKTEKGSKVFLGISHSKKRKNMFPLTQDGISGITVDEETSFGLANTPSKILNEIGTVSIDKAQELLNSIDEKKIAKIDKRNNPDK